MQQVVISSTPPSRGREKPKLNVSSSLLEAAGFKPGDKVEIKVSPGEIRIALSEGGDDQDATRRYCKDKQGNPCEDWEG